MTIRSKLILSYLFLLVAVLCIGVSAYWSARNWRHSATELTRTHNQGTAAERLRADIYRQIAAGTHFVSGSRGSEKDFWEIQPRVAAEMQRLKSAARAPEEIDHLGALEETQRELVYFAKEIFASSAKTGHSPKADPGEKLDDIGDEVTSDVAALNQYYQTLEKASLDAASRSGGIVAYLVVAAALFTLAELLTMVFLLQRWLAGPIAEVGRVTSKISRGDFEARVTVNSKDEWGELAGSVNRMAEELKNYEHKLRAQERLAAMGELASFAAHNIRNPLAGIRAASQVMLAECKKEPAAKESLEDIIRSVDKLDVWIQRLLGFARPLTIEPVKTELSTLIEDCLHLSEAQQRAGKIVVQNRVNRLPPVAADPALLEQVLSAVVVNALEAMVEGGNLTVEAFADEQEATLVVSDTGKGIPPGLLERVFKPFVTDKPAGTGLGLAQAKKIVDLHGGSIKIESRPGAGTTVAIALPLWREEN